MRHTDKEVELTKTLATKLSRNSLQRDNVVRHVDLHRAMHGPTGRSQPQAHMSDDVLLVSLAHHDLLPTARAIENERHPSWLAPVLCLSRLSRESSRA